MVASKLRTAMGELAAIEREILALQNRFSQLLDNHPEICRDNAEYFSLVLAFDEYTDRIYDLFLDVYGCLSGNRKERPRRIKSMSVPEFTQMMDNAWKCALEETEAKYLNDSLKRK